MLDWISFDSAGRRLDHVLRCMPLVVIPTAVLHTAWVVVQAWASWAFALASSFAAGTPSLDTDTSLADIPLGVQQPLPPNAVY